MRNGKTLLRWMEVMVVLAVVSMGCTILLSGEPAQAASALEATESGAPSAMVIFPVSDKANPKGMGMRPVVFNHLNHEKKITECETCHHTGDTVSCTSCHTVEGKKEGNFVTLDQAMHTPTVAKRSTGKTPVSCVSCHNDNLKRRECAGCHSIVIPTKNDANCATCHNVTGSMTPEQMVKGSEGKLSAEENEALATETVLAQKPAVAISPKSIPQRVTIDAIADEYAPAVFTHGRHVESLMKRMGNDKLASAFHNNPATLCAACHHNSPLSATPPKCSSCHTVTIDPATPERPALKAAYHLQCMSCHNAMKVTRPQNTSCTTCHKERAN